MQTTSTPDEYFGLTREYYDELLTFGEWGELPTSFALRAFTAAHAYFDTEDAQKSDKDRQDYIDTCKKWYEGYHPKPLKVEAGQFDDNILINLCRPLIDDSVTWLFGASETGYITMRPVPKQEGGAVDDGTVNAAMAGIVKNSGGAKLFKKLGLRGSIGGHFFLKLVPDAGIPINELRPEHIRFVVMDPRLVAVQLDPTDEETHLAYKVEWKRSNVKVDGRNETIIYRQLIVLVDEVEGMWAVGDFWCKDKDKKRDWKISSGPWAWPWRWSPIISGPNIEAPWGEYGYSDLEDITGINNAINAAITNYGKILRHHAHPKTVGIGFTADDISATEIGSLWTIPNENAKIENLEMDTDLVSSMNFINMLSMYFWNIGRGLDPASFKNNVANVTNFALRVLALRALDKLEDKRSNYGTGLKDAVVRAMDMLGMQIDDVQIEWPDPLPNNPTAIIDKLEKEVGLMITSRETAATELGRIWTIEKKRIMDEQLELESLGSAMIEAFERDRSGMKMDDRRTDADEN